MLGITLLLGLLATQSSSWYLNVESESNRSTIDHTEKFFDTFDEVPSYRMGDARHDVTTSLGCKQKLCPSSDKPQTRVFKLNALNAVAMTPACGDCPDTVADCSNPRCVPADGIKRIIFPPNGEKLGLIYEVCKGDTVVVTMNNLLAAMSIHWHGITQEMNPYMDGVSYLTQCPVKYKVQFPYQFVATDVGTHFWYAEIMQDGFAGGLIVRSADEPLVWMYDRDEHVIFIQNWRHNSVLMEALGGSGGYPKQNPENILINGKGAICTSGTRDISDSSIEGCNDECTKMPIEKFTVQKNKNYRMRIIHAGGFECPIQFQIENHKMILIATDGTPVVPVPELKTLVLMNGERYDVVVSANQKVGSYWIIVKSIGKCSSDNVYQRAILTYDGAESEDPASPNPGYSAYSLQMVLNPLSKQCIGSADSDMTGVGDSGEDEELGICAYQLRSLDENGPLPTTNPVKHVLEFKKIITQSPIPGLPVSDINGKSLKIPPFLVLGTSDIAASFSDFACKENITTVQKCFNTIPIGLGDIVDLIFVDVAPDATEPTSFHLHGYKFDLLYQGFSVSEAEDDQLLNLICPSKRDTFVVPAGGVARIRFVANNPGLWLLRDTLPSSYTSGMGLVLQVGTANDLPPKPANFPKCDKPMFVAGPARPDWEILDITSESSSESSSDSSSSS